MSLIDEVETEHTDLFANKTALKNSYQPNEIVGRDEELREITRLLLDVRDGEKPPTVFVLGHHGVGKTVVTRYVLEEYTADEGGEVPVQYVRVNCESFNRSYHITAKMANELLDRAEFTTSNPGVAQSAIWDTIFASIEDFGGVTIVMLDEIGEVIDRDKLLYQLSRAENNYLDEAVVGTVCVSTDGSIVDQIGPDARSSLSPQSVILSSYGAHQIQNLLEHRAKLGFKDGVLAGDALKYAAAIGAKSGGDARTAMDLLRGAGDLAEREGDDLIQQHHVESFEQQLASNKVFDIVRDQIETHSRYTVCAMLSLYFEADSPAQSEFRTTAISDRYKQLAPDPNTTRQVRRYLREFDNVGLTDRTPRPRRSGGDAHRFLFDADMIYGALQEFIENEIDVPDDEAVPSGIRQLRLTASSPP